MIAKTQLVVRPRTFPGQPELTEAGVRSALRKTLIVCLERRNYEVVPNDGGTYALKLPFSLDSNQVQAALRIWQTEGDFEVLSKEN